MIPALRQQFNANFTPEKYQNFLKLMEERCGVGNRFRLAETPCFFPKALLEKAARYGKELIQQLGSLEYRKNSFDVIPEDYKVLREAPRPLFAQVDFGFVYDAKRELQPKLIELQGSPSLYAFQAMLSQVYIEAFELDDSLNYLLGELDWEAYKQLFKRAVLGDKDPTNVIQMDIEPTTQKALADYLLTERLLGIKTVPITDIKKDGNALYYQQDGKKVPIERIYNRLNMDALVRRNLKFAFRFTDDLKVEWAGHPNWCFRISKFAIPHLNHVSVPKTQFLDRVEPPPNDLQNYVIKAVSPLAGIGTLMNPSRADLLAIPKAKRAQFVLQERENFEALIDTPSGPTRPEVRVMYIWTDELLPVIAMVRLGRGLMMGADENRNVGWVGTSAGLFPEI